MFSFYRLIARVCGNYDAANNLASKQRLDGQLYSLSESSLMEQLHDRASISERFCGQATQLVSLSSDTPALNRSSFVKLIASLKGKMLKCLVNRISS